MYSLNNSLLGQLMNVKNPEVFYQKLMQTNPQFANFVNANRGKSPEQIAKENGIDPSVLKLFK